MADLHHMPLLGHDLPAYEPEVFEVSREQWLAMNKRARVYKAGPHWTWDHWCAWKNHTTNGYPHDTQDSAFFFAWDHVVGCVG